MAKQVVWTQTAWNDLSEVADYITEDSPYYAASFVQEAGNTARSLATLSTRGRIVPEFGDSKIRELFG